MPTLNVRLLKYDHRKCTITYSYPWLLCGTSLCRATQWLHKIPTLALSRIDLYLLKPSPLHGRFVPASEVSIFGVALPSKMQEVDGRMTLSLPTGINNQSGKCLSPIYVNIVSNIIDLACDSVSACCLTQYFPLVEKTVSKSFGTQRAEYVVVCKFLKQNGLQPFVHHSFSNGKASHAWTFNQILLRLQALAAIPNMEAFCLHTICCPRPHCD